MIAKAAAISYGAANLRYITGESRGKDESKVHWIFDQNMDPGANLDAAGYYALFSGISQRDKRKIKNGTISITLSPAREHTQGWTREHWRQLAEEFLLVMDSLTVKDRKGNVVSQPTNLQGCYGVGYLHQDTDDDHMHLALSRCDVHGHIVDAAFIGRRAAMAAEIIAMRRGWKTAMQYNVEYREALYNDCMDVLRAMDRWNWIQYVKGLETKGYRVSEKRDKEGKLRGYAVLAENRKYKSSEIGPGRKLMPSAIESTWAKMHKDMQSSIVRNGAGAHYAAHGTAAKAERTVPYDKEIEAGYQYYAVERPESVPYRVEHGGKHKDFWLSRGASEVLEQMFPRDAVENAGDLIESAVAHFVGLAFVPVSAGGGGAVISDMPWGRRPEDEDEWMRRCCQRAAQRIPVARKRGGKKRK